MTDDQESFRAQVSASPVLRERWLSLTDRLATEAVEKHGVDVPREAFAAMSGVRLAVLTGEEFGDLSSQMIGMLPQFSKLREYQNIRDQVDREGQADELGGMSPSEKMAFARATARSPATKPTKATKEAELAQLHRAYEVCRSPAMRMKIARQIESRSAEGNQ